MKTTRRFPTKRCPTKILLLLIMMTSLAGCHHVDDDRIPPALVYIPFNTVGEWDLYGVAAATDHRIFIKSEHVPQGYPYIANSQTGFGGVLLVCDIHGYPVAYDLACPVECRYNVRVQVDTERYVAECPVCHSTYDIVTNYGYPLSGPAAAKGYALRRYYAGPGPGGEYMAVTR